MKQQEETLVFRTQDMTGGLEDQRTNKKKTKTERHSPKSFNNPNSYDIQTNPEYIEQQRGGNMSRNGKQCR